MSSMLCRKEQGGQMVVHDSNLVEDLTVDSNNQIHTLMVRKQNSAQRRRMPRPNTTPSPSRSQSRNMDSNSLIGKTMKVQDWLNEKTVRTLQESRESGKSSLTKKSRSSRASLASNRISSAGTAASETMADHEKSDLESKAARKLYSPILQTEDTFVKDMEDFINHRDMTSLRKKEVLHKNWSERVYKPLRKKIIDAMDSNDWPEVDRRKRELHRQYLEFTNDKGHVFLDTMDPEEYYAMALNGHRPAPIKVETRPLHDPLISQGRQRSEEDRTILRCLTGYRYTDRDIDAIKMPAMPLVPLGRHGTDSLRWLEMPLSNIESTPRLASRKRMGGRFNDTDIDFEQWRNTPYNHSAVDRELQIQKKRMYAEDEKPPFPKPLIRRVPVPVPVKPMQRSVSFHEPVVQEVIAIEPLNQSVQQMSIGVGAD